MTTPTNKAAIALAGQIKGVKGLLRLLALDLEKYEAKVEAATTDWGYFGDVGHIAAKILELTRVGRDFQRYSLDGQLIESTVQFLADNDFDPEIVDAMASLAVDQSVTLGGGAAAEFVLRRVA
jgi:hypothetical protein